MARQKDGFIFWKQDLRVAGSGSTADAVARLRTQLSASRFAFQERLVGTLEGSRLRAWRASPFGQAGDVVEFEGTLRPAAEGTVIEGSVQYKTATKVQFTGLLVIGFVLLAVGAFQKLSDPHSGAEPLGMGGFITLLTLFWIYSSSKMKHTQIQFIESRLGEAVAK
ncbi:MAG: hypothetical protein FJY54_17410 [Betaproteobacteria bacterium]|nr:hypothetical protein [Betaproteobacteria bacterium]